MHIAAARVMRVVMLQVIKAAYDTHRTLFTSMIER
jgi:hypothetical protein